MPLHTHENIEAQNGPTVRAVMGIFRSTFIMRPYSSSQVNFLEFHSQQTNVYLTIHT